MSRQVRKLAEIPTLHLLMIVAPFTVILFCLLLMPFYPKEEHGFLQTTIVSCLTFIFGKFTNGFGRPMGTPTPKQEEEKQP